MLDAILADRGSQLKYAVVQLSATGAVVAANATCKIRVLAYTLSFAGTVNVKWQSASTDLTGLKYGTVGLIHSPGFCPVGWFETVKNEALNLNLSASIAVGGEIAYVLIPN